MSLLLDALKKAAEHKAGKNQGESLEGATSDETVLDQRKEDISRLDSDDDSNLNFPARPLDDETELDHSELKTRMEQVRQQRSDADETALDASQIDAADESEHQATVDSAQGTHETQLDIAEETQTQSSLSAQMQTGEDETIIFADEDVSEFMGDLDPRRTPLANPEDETDLSQVPAAADDSELGYVRQPATDDETDLSQIVAADDETDLSQIAAADDGTDLSHLQVEQPGDETDLRQPVESESETGANTDMSLLLVQRDDTDISMRISPTDPGSASSRARLLDEESTITDAEIGLVDITRSPTIADATDTHDPGSEATATTGVSPQGADNEEGTLTRAAGTIMRGEATSTRTYAPDNYDRTLMKLPSEDASKLFSGMKSESDVVMTPDYAKKVFKSKASAKRMHFYKIYTGIAVAILLTFGIYGLFEFQDQSAAIDADLQPLKYDPMPGLINLNSGGGPTVKTVDNSSFEVDSKTIELIENADVQSEGVIGQEEVEVDLEADVEEVAETEVVTATEEIQPSTQLRNEPEKELTEIASVDPESAPVEKAIEPEPASSTLQITSSKRVDKNYLLLREAYAAYLAGNDAVALEKYNQVLEIDPGNRNALLARAAINVQNNNSAAAIKDYQTLLLANPKDSLAMSSLVSVANSLPRETETQLKLMIREEPDSPYLNFALANVYGAQDRWQEAQGLYFKALENNPRDPNYAYNLAVSLEHISKPKVAIGFYQRALDNFEYGLAIFSKNVVDQRLEVLRKL